MGIRARLSGAEIERSQETGLVIPDYRLSNSTVEQLRKMVDKLIADHAHLRPRVTIGAPQSVGSVGRPRKVHLISSSSATPAIFWTWSSS